MLRRELAEAGNRLLRDGHEQALLLELELRAGPAHVRHALRQEGLDTLRCVLRQVVQEVHVLVVDRGEAPHCDGEVLLVELLGEREALLGQGSQRALMPVSQRRQRPEGVANVLWSVLLGPDLHLVTEGPEEALVLPVDRAEGPNEHGQVARLQLAELSQGHVRPEAAPAPLALRAAHLGERPGRDREAAGVEGVDVLHGGLD
mmetsp:Transcript_67914/g.199457  ORF Transcript_67914/g.199457 Transcript_67914/m.199457 type:complete len:203 (-) Transcript_67914:337-945(-)